MILNFLVLSTTPVTNKANTMNITISILSDWSHFDSSLTSLTSAGNMDV